MIITGSKKTPNFFAMRRLLMVGLSSRNVVCPLAVCQAFRTFANLIKKEFKAVNRYAPFKSFKTAEV